MTYKLYIFLFLLSFLSFLSSIWKKIFITNYRDIIFIIQKILLFLENDKMTKWQNDKMTKWQNILVPKLPKFCPCFLPFFYRIFIFTFYFFTIFLLYFLFFINNKKLKNIGIILAILAFLKKYFIIFKL